MPLSPTDPALTAVVARLDPLLEPVGFARGQVGSDDRHAQITYCRGVDQSPDVGCIDLVIDLEHSGDWHIVDVRYWGFPPDRWRLPFDRYASLPDQLAGLERSLPEELR